jgi:hypothetical protein
MTNYEKIIKVMCWDSYDGESPEQTYQRKIGNAIPPPNEIIDIVEVGGLQKWAEMLEVSSQVELYSKLLKAIRLTVADPIFNDRKLVNTFPPFANFFYFCQKLDRNGKTATEAEAIADIAWNGVICKRNNQNNIQQMFSVKPDADKYKAISEKIRQTWGFSEKEIDAFRYFVCQTRHEGHNPSLNKSIYLWGKKKGTGKTTVGRAIITILNGDKWDNYGIYESTLNKEMGYNDHDLPLAALYNCVFLDETVPKDSRKSYGGVKRMLTSNSFNYNPKFRQVLTIPCKRLYIFTSNDDIAEFIQDESERRFVSIEIDRSPDQLTFDEIYDIWKEFAVNCEPEEDWKEWYDSFALVNGLEKLNIDEVKNELFLRKEELFATMNGAGSYFTIKSLANALFKNEPTREQRHSVKSAVAELFHDCKTKSNDALYSKTSCRERLLDIEAEKSKGEIEETETDDNGSGLPF